MKNFIYILSFLFLSCSAQDSFKPTIHHPSNTNLCKSACNHLAKLKGQDGKPGCQESRLLVYPSGNIETCEQFCTATQNNGRDLNPKCWLTLTSCNDLEKVCRQ
jgi:hypothetical protein